MAHVLLGTLFGLISLICSIFILLHAFRRSTGTGVMVLCIPCFMLYYAFSQFEHRRKDVIVSGWLASLLMAVVLYGSGVQALLGPTQAFPG